MNLQEIIYRVLVLLMLVVLSVGVLKLDDKGKSKTYFYEYENSKINLLQVKRITSRVSYYATLAEDKSDKEINAVLIRRDLIIDWLNKRIEKLGEEKVFY